MWGLEDDWSLFTSISSTTGSLILLWAPIWATLFKPFRIDSGVGNWQNRSLTLHGPFFQFILIFSQLPFHRHPWSEPAPLHHLQHQSAWQSHSALPAVIKVMEIHWIIVQCVQLYLDVILDIFKLLILSCKLVDLLLILKGYHNGIITVSLTGVN